MLVRDLSFAGETLGIRVDAMIGFDFIGQGPFTIDYHSRKVVFGPIDPSLTAIPYESYMQNCRNTMQPMMQTNSQAKKDIEAAKASNDPAKMRSALDEAEKAIEGMNTHMTTCMSMMNMMQNMHGMVGNGKMGDQRTPQTPNPPKQ